VHLIEGHSDRNSPSGAWVYPIAPDASGDDRLGCILARCAARPFDAARFFRWRCFKDYGEGVAGDLYVHLLSGMQCISGINAIPSRAYSTGSLTHFNDGRDFPDLLATLYDYPGVTVNLHCNQNNEAGEPIIFYGSEATMVINGNTLTVTPQDTSPQPEGYSLNGWTAAAKQQYLDEWHAAHPAPPRGKLGEVETYSAPRATTTPPTTSPTSSAPSRRASMSWRTRSSATTRPSPATWPITLTFTAPWPRGMRRRKRSRADFPRREPRE
jgi:predicted dehydrogenase